MRVLSNDVYQSWYIRIGEACIRVLNPLRRIYRLENFQQDVYSCKAASVFHQWAHSPYLIIVSNCVYLVKSLSPNRVSQKRNYYFLQNYSNFPGQQDCRNIIALIRMNVDRRKMYLFNQIIITTYEKTRVFEEIRMIAKIFIFPL